MPNSVISRAVTFGGKLHLPLWRPMEVTIRPLGNVQFEATTRGHRVVCDQPATNGGTDKGMTPPEMLLSALGTCAGHYAVQYLTARNLSAEGLEIAVRAEKFKAPARLDSFCIEVLAPGLDPDHEAGLLRAVKICLVHNTLLHAPSIETVLRTSAEEPVPRPR